MKQKIWSLSLAIPLIFMGLMICWPNDIRAAENSANATAPAQTTQTATNAGGVSTATPAAPASVAPAAAKSIQKKDMAEAPVPKAKPAAVSATKQPMPPVASRSTETGCVQAESKPVTQTVKKTMDEASFFNAQVHDLAVQLIQNFNGDSGPGSPIAVSTFVDLNNLHKTSPFGRYLAEQLMGELQRAGFRVIEVRKTDSILVKERYGEYSLSRDTEEIANEASAQLVLVGTYITRGKYILINARIVSNRQNMLASSAMKILRRDRFLDRMLWPTMAPDTSPTVKIPIKEFGQPTEVKIISGS